MSSIEWETPQDFFDTLDKEFHFTMDAAATGANKKCHYYLSKENNSLVCPWSGIVWLNPPYSKNIDHWLEKAYYSAQAGVTVVCLIQGRSSDTRWWHKYVMKASEIRYIKDRLHFGINGKFSRANISSIVVIFRPYCQGPPQTLAIDTKGHKL